ncbi:MAG: hypothetical protein IIC67_07260 [Thaumarchaeota archaeon]|nr:hypothetical protein [Nitrososphaerota archaeon]
MTDKIIHFKDFVKNIKELLNHCELRETKSIQDPDVWRSRRRGNDPDFFVLKKSAGYPFFRGLTYLRDQIKNKNLEFSDDFLNNSFVNFVESQTRKNGNVYNHCQTWFDDLCVSHPRKFVFLIPLSHYDYKHEIDLDIIKIVKITDEIINQEFSIPKQLTQLYNAEELIQDNDTKTYAIVKLSAFEASAAEDAAYNVVEKFIYAIKLIDPGSHIRLRKRVMKQVNERILSSENGNFTDGGHTHNLPVRVTPSDDFYNKLQPYWDKLSSFLYSDNPTDLQQVILSTLYWYGETDVHTDSKVKQFLNFITGLEWIVLHVYERTLLKSNKFSQNCAILFSGDKKYSDFWEKYYSKRNDLNHQKLVDIYKEEIDTLRLNLRSLLLQLIKHTDNYDTLKEVFEKEYKIL